MVTTKVNHPSLADRREAGAQARSNTPPDSHTGWKPATDRPDPVDSLVAQNVTREVDLVPVRHGRMALSPFTFYRGAAKIMATDLAATPTAGLTVQLCGDAPLSNFGAFASPERKLLFDLNDFDETLPGPFEWDVKRMAASFTIAARNNGLTPAEGKAAAQAAVRSYRTAMAEFAEMRVMDLWYTKLSEDDLRAALLNMSSRKPVKSIDKLDKVEKAEKKSGAKDKKQAKATKGDKSAEAQAKAIKAAEKGLAKAHTRDSLQALSKLGEQVDGQYRIGR